MILFNYLIVNGQVFQSFLKFKNAFFLKIRPCIFMKQNKIRLLFRNSRKNAKFATLFNLGKNLTNTFK